MGTEEAQCKKAQMAEAVKPSDQTGQAGTRKATCLHCKIALRTRLRFLPAIVNTLSGVN